MVNMLGKEGFVNISVTLFDFMHPIIPKPLVDCFEYMFSVLEKIPIIKEFGGSLLIKGKRPV